MKNFFQIKFMAALFVPMVLMILFASCKKDATVTPVVTTVISAVTTDATTLSDVETLSCQLPDTVSAANLPAALTSYLTTNYASATTQFVYAVKANGTITGYVANLLSGTTHTSTRFDAAGNFVKAVVLPAHSGFAMFQTDTVGVSTLPTALQTYLTANNTTFTVQRIFREADSTYTIIATQTGASTYVMSYSNATPTALNVINVGMADFTTPSPDIATLPASIATYIAQNYNGAAIERVLSENCTGASNGYTIILKQNTTQYALEFDATGAFMTALVAN